MELFIIQLKKLFILQKNILIKTIKYSQNRDSQQTGLHFM